MSREERHRTNNIATAPTLILWQVEPVLPFGKCHLLNYQPITFFFFFNMKKAFRILQNKMRNW